MANTLFPPGSPPTWQVPTPLLQRRPRVPTAYPLTYVFDPVTGDLAADGGGRVKLSSPRASAVQAAAFLVTIQQATYPIFSRAFGIDLEGAIRNGRGRAATEARLSDRMRRSAIRDARVRNLDTFVFDWRDGDRLTVTYTLELTDGTRVRQERRLT